MSCSICNESKNDVAVICRECVYKIRSELILLDDIKEKCEEEIKYYKECFKDERPSVIKFQIRSQFAKQILDMFKEG